MAGLNGFALRKNEEEGKRMEEGYNRKSIYQKDINNPALFKSKEERIRVKS
jgi:hypothetical protein